MTLPEVSLVQWRRSGDQVALESWLRSGESARRLGGIGGVDVAARGRPGMTKRGAVGSVASGAESSETGCDYREREA